MKNPVVRISLLLLVLGLGQAVITQAPPADEPTVPEKETEETTPPAGTEAGDATEASDTTQPPTPPAPVYSKLRFLTGYKGATYFQIGNSIAELPGAGIQVLESSGSIENILSIRDGKADAGIAQMDILMKFALRRDDIKSKVKILLPLYLEELHILVKKNVGSLESLERKKISIGPRSSGSNATARIVLNAIGLDESIVKISYTSPHEALPALINKKDETRGVFIVAGAPVNMLKSLSAKSNITMLDVDEEIFESLVKEGLPYKMTTIKKGQYSWLKKNIDTLGVSSAIIIKSSASAAQVSSLVRSIYTNHDSLKTKHEKWREFSPGLATFYANAYSQYFHPSAKAAILSN